jgi:hypothetical protein
MTVKTFTAGSVLTAADTNEYLANSGWTYVNSGTFTAQSPLQVNSVFTSTYSNYKVILENITSTAGNPATTMQLTVGGTPSTANYSHGSQYWTFATTPVSAAFGSNAGAAWDTMLFNTTPASYVEYTLYGPAIARATGMTWNGSFYTNTYRTGGGLHNVATAYDGFRIIPASSTLNGTWTVLGQRKA